MPKPEMSKDKKPYHERLPQWPEFALPKNKIDGPLPSCRVNSWKDFIDHMQSPQHNLTEAEMVYRGQRRYDWGLSSTFSRAGPRPLRRGDSSEKIQEDLLEQFKLAMRGRGPDLGSLDDKEIWALGQHNGLHTPLLDWTKSPFVALYFAFWGLDPDPAPIDEELNTSRTIFCLNMTHLREMIPGLFFEPISNENARLVNQAGLFTLTPTDEKDLVSYIIRTLVYNKAIGHVELEDDSTDDGETDYQVDKTALRMSDYLCKIHIPNPPIIARDECLTMLRKMNIHHGSLFPDPSGAAHYCNDWLCRPKAHSSEWENMERQARDSETKAKPFIEKMKGGAGLLDLIRETIREHFDQDIVPDETAEDWAEEILVLYRYYEFHAMPYWPNRPMVHHSFSIEVIGLVDLLGIESILKDPRSKVFELSDDLVAIFVAHHQVNHYPGLGKKNAPKLPPRK